MTLKSIVKFVFETIVCGLIGLAIGSVFALNF
jgi:tetrahydromethanopterin S-methyltransferase subunit F